MTKLPHFPLFTLNDFQHKLQMRMREYVKSIDPVGQTLLSTVLTNWQYFNEQLMLLDKQYDLFGNQFWGYGINHICDGKTEYKNLDVKVIEGLSANNKHLDHQIFNMIIFKVDKEDFVFSTFSFNLLQLKWQSSLLQRISLKRLRNVRPIINNQYTSIEIEFEDLQCPVFFQVDDYHSYQANPTSVSKAYVDYLLHFAGKLPKPAPGRSIMKYLKPIPREVYFHRHVREEETMNFYRDTLSGVDPRLELGMHIYDLPDVFKVTERWRDILTNRLRFTPDHQLAKDAFKKELLQTLDYDYSLPPNDPANKGKFWNQYRNVTYEHAVKGEAVTLKYLGHIVLKYQCWRPEGIEVVDCITCMPDVKGLLESFAEGVAVAMFVHGSDHNRQQKFPINEKGLFKDVFESQPYLDVLKRPEIGLLNDHGDYIGGMRKKSIISAWISVLDRKGVLQQIPRSERTRLVNDLIPHLNISEKSLYNKQSDNYYAMLAPLESLIDKI